MKSLTIRMQTFRGSLARFAPIVLLAAFFTAAPFDTAMAQVAPPLGTTQSVAVLGGSTVVNTGPSVLTGDLDLSPGTVITGFPPGNVIAGTTHPTDAVALQAQSDTTIAYINLAGRPVTRDLTGLDLGGMTLTHGVYSFSTSAQLTGVLTLDAAGDPTAVWVFQIGSTLTTASSSSVVLIHGAQPCNVFWQVGSSATLGTSTTFVGNIFALTSITLITNANVAGRLLARNGAVTMDTNTVAISVCGVPAVTPTLSTAFSPATINAGGTSTLTITLTNPNSSAASLTAPFTDTLPSGVVVSGGGSTTCGGVLTATAGSSTVTLTGGTIPANDGSCALTVDVVAASGGTYINSLPIGALVTSNGSNAAPVVATLTVSSSVVTPTLGKAFNPATIAAGGTSTLTITLSNAGTTAARVTAPLTARLRSGGGGGGGGASTTCLGGTATTGAPTVALLARTVVRPRWFGGNGGSNVTLTGGTIPAGGSCTVTVSVTAPVAGSYFNSILAGALQTDEGNNAAPAIATLTVSALSPVALGKAFSPATIAAGGISTLTITLNNPNNTAATLNAPLTDILPSGVVTTGSASTTCVGGTPSTGASTVTPTAQWASAASTVTLTGGTIPAGGSCTLTVSVTAPVAGSYINSLLAGALQTTNGNNTAPGVATLTVNAITKPDITLAMVTPGTVQITRGAPATVMMAVITNPSNVPIPADVTFGCAVPPALTGTTCSLSPSPIRAGSPSGTTTMLTISTVRGTTNSNLFPSGAAPRLPLYLPLVSIAALLAMGGILGFARNSASRRLPYYLTVALLAATAVGLAGCAGSTTGTASLSGTTSVAGNSVTGTPMGPSIITVTSTAGGVMKSVSIPINVN